MFVGSRIEESTNNASTIQAQRESNFSPPANNEIMSSTQPVFNREVLPYENPSDEMVRRWKSIIERSLPAIDLIDLAAEHNYFYSQKRQFAPEYSQAAYLTILRSELAIGDYIDFQEG